MLPTVAEFADALAGPSRTHARRAPPQYVPRNPPGRKVFLAVEPFKRHMTDEGWQLQLGMEQAGYSLYGRRFPGDRNMADVVDIVRRTAPGTVIVQDKREWDPKCGGCFDKDVAFTNAGQLTKHPDIFRLTVFKDAHQDPAYHCDAHREFDVHAWLIYYHPTIVCKLAPWLRPEHLIRIYHTLDPKQIPQYYPHRPFPCVLSGSCSGAYPLRQRIAAIVAAGDLPDVFVHPHPGYHADGSHTNSYLRMLTQYRVSICTASKYGYALRKLIESTACGCRVITNLPVDDVMPYIDDNLVRVPNNITTAELQTLIAELAGTYDPERQAHYARLAVTHYDYRARFALVAEQIEQMRAGWVNPAAPPPTPPRMKVRAVIPTPKPKPTPVQRPMTFRPAGRITTNKTRRVT